MRRVPINSNHFSHTRQNFRREKKKAYIAAGQWAFNLNQAESLFYLQDRPAGTFAGGWLVTGHILTLTPGSCQESCTLVLSATAQSN